MSLATQLKDHSSYDDFLAKRGILQHLKINQQ
jgi:hypothetical protein